MARTVYMDCHSTTPVDPRVVEAMLPYLTEHFGNPASRTHAFGWTAKKAVERARQQVADLIGANPREVVFTSGATESNNLALKGSCRRPGHLITVATEHKAVLDPCAQLEDNGWTVTRLGVGADGLVDLEAVKRSMTDRTALVSMMAANNETGVLQPVAAAARIAKASGALFHTDAAQAVGKIPFDVNKLGVDLASLSAHKMYGPKGVGALYVRRLDPRVTLEPLIAGGGHERGFRSGTLNVPGIVGFGMAAELCASALSDDAKRLRDLRDRLLEGLRASLGGLHVNGSMTERLPHNLNVSFEGVDGPRLLMGLTDLAVSSGAACMSATTEPPYVLMAMGMSGGLAQASIRFGLGRFNTVDDVDFAVRRVVEVVRSLRGQSSSLGPDHPVSPVESN